MDIKTYKDAVESFDWLFEMSDDFGVFKRGLERYRELMEMAYGNEQLKRIFESKQDEVNREIRKA